MQDRLRLLPAMNALLERRAIKGLLKTYRREVVTALARDVLTEQRSEIQKAKAPAKLDKAGVLRACEERLLAMITALEEPKLRRVINATGVLLHTNVGRARLSAEVADELRRAAVEGVALEVDLDTNRRGGRSARVSQWLKLLTGAEDAAATNNGAAALWLAVRATARTKASVLVARGEQVAIGGSFRMPELMRTTGARMLDVGTTNRTTVDDYAAQLGEGDVILKVHPSNYRIEGFTEESSLSDLGALCRERGAHLIFDAGSGSLYNFGKYGLTGEYGVSQALQAGADLVTFSGDKLLGGPQAGLIVGRADLVSAVKKHPLMRALRLDKLVLAALESTLATYARTPSGARPDLPLFDALDVTTTELRRRAKALVNRLAPRIDECWSLRVANSTAAIGGGSFAQNPIKSVAMEIGCDDAASLRALHRTLRRSRPAVLAGIDDGLVRVDLRAVLADEIEDLSGVLEIALRSG